VKEVVAATPNSK